ncbi:hypothetical protein [Streptomyces sp. NRRL B-24484]|uniref:hypothetical protein n=1 Tax=Streptomyces sp. NRRL B-24484 TaxID=1463833 RepID=UPI001F23BFAD|nr:hypothetical protein [Streptomyces sp. NRRL B-24484]
MQIAFLAPAFGSSPSGPAPARDCCGCNGWGTLVAPDGRGLIVCPECRGNGH